MAGTLRDAIVGDTWDRMVNRFRVCPPLLVGVGATLAVDTVSTVPWFRDPKQAMKLGRLVRPTLAAHARRPWRLLGPVASIMRSSGRSEEHTSELQSLMRISYAVFCLKKKKKNTIMQLDYNQEDTVKHRQMEQ